ncbi:MAG: membrane or secreted protein [Flavobacteriales bacterium]|nr:membrane or secreted protein [Flavobacteriales bacterium]
MKTVLIAIALLALGFAGIAIKIWAKKDGKFEGTCASNNPLITKEGEPCGYCGAESEEQCKSDEMTA